MKAEIKYLSSADIDPLEAHSATGSFSFQVDVMLGPVGVDAEESFQVTVCSPQYLEENLGDDIFNARHTIITREFSYKKFKEFVEKTFLSFEEDSWEELGLKISRCGYWEFEDYQEYEEHKEIK